MNNPFEYIEARLDKIEILLLDIIQNPNNMSGDKHDNPIDIKAVSELTGLSVPTLYGYCHRREIPFHKIGNRSKFFRNEILAWIKSKKQETFKEIEANANKYLK
ncbi:helix-turn-helix transcriptional regulator [Pontimicrobium aquaticum]|uniref:Helix-turn-helix domain-containing protein n=1 Tax=Pontimicrobium aquaticum TaxID=2565367 RepID=A0A4U0F184_9FLAO|nr:helix-turn-helix domain-containing protein [Pontimicrobium aquaticum]TJY38201.1 helix-turn-helix domain-containing protein [Pontimicrobium aquaticum]